MYTDKLLSWLDLSKNRTLVLGQFNQPLTAKHIATRLSISLDMASYTLWELMVYRLVRCMNPRARKSRLYWLTDEGQRCQAQIRTRSKQDPIVHNLPDIDWKQYAWLCFEHRAAVVKAMIQPMRPFEVRQRIQINQPRVKIGQNHVSRTIQELLRQGTIQLVPDTQYSVYQLSDRGRLMREILFNAERPVLQPMSTLQ